MKPEIGIIGGSGLYSMPGFEAQEESYIDTPFGRPSDNYVVGTLAGDAGIELAGAGLYDTTRLATSPPDIWRDVAATKLPIKTKFISRHRMG